MQHRFRKLKEVMKRVQHAKSTAAAFRLAGQAGGEDGNDLYWPDLIIVLESLLPSGDEFSEALADIRTESPGCVESV